ncbi:N-acetyltransferase family protein [Paenalcaligenes sp. Me52]|uniref:GNAT family N-acetyltransferase n=1 Tax=Paenalcaligenes sp. Me52 TaxID=3392038 RepID=UPI003D2E3C68
MSNLIIRRASAADAPAVLAIFDEVVAWFLTIGNEQQWGVEPWSAQPHQQARVSEACSLPGAWVVEDPNGTILAALVLGDAMPYVPAATEPELYVRLLIASRNAKARGVGKRLLAFADDQARVAKLTHLRVDCYGGGTGALIRFYESCGYKRLATFEVEGWPGQILGRAL